MSKDLSETTGLHVVAQTPFLDDGAVDYASIDTLSAFYYRHGAQGLTVLGVSGEAQKLTVDETVAVAARYVAAATGHRIIAGVSHPNLATLVEVTRDVMAEGADAVMICPPQGSGRTRTSSATSTRSLSGSATCPPCCRTSRRPQV